MHANWSNSAVQDWLESDNSPISYGVLNLNLNDLKTFAEGLSQYNIFPNEKVNTFLPTRNEKGEQIFTRAPNFRTPGGYKPPATPKKCRDLTDEQIREEVRKMYAFPDANDEENEKEEVSDQNKVSNVKAGGSKDRVEEKLKEEEENIDLTKSHKHAKENPKVDFNFLHDTPAPNEFGKGKHGKPIKRKLLPNGGGVCGGTIGSIPDLGFGLRNLNLEEVKEPIVERTTSWNVGQQQCQTEGMQAVDLSEHASCNSKKGPVAFSFGYGEEENLLSPIRSSVNQDSECVVNASLLQSQRVQKSPEQKDETECIALNDKNQNMFDHSPISSSFASSMSQGTGTKTTEDQEPISCQSNPESKSLPTSTSLLSSSSSKTSKRRLIRKAATKFRAMPSPRSVKESTIDSAQMESIQSDLEKILSEIDIPPDELESLINNLDDSDISLPKVGLLEDIELDGGFTDAFSQIRLDDWSSNSHHSEKYHTEKFKREQCEKELRSLQEAFLAEKQQTAVLEGTLKRRNLMLVQMTMAFNRVCKEWKKFDSVNKAAVSKLQHDQKILAAACKHSKERINQYEKELHKTLELADSFKSKLFDLQKERDDSVRILEQANSELEEKVSRLKEEMEALKSERDATLRALRESQIKLDEGKLSLERMEEQLKILEKKDTESIQKYNELLQAKSQQHSSYLDVVARREELEALVLNLNNELTLEKTSKDKLKQDMQGEAERRTRVEAERLHEYYNKEVKEILKSATEEAARAEAVLKDQMRRAAIESERKLAECEEKFKRELEAMKARYEAEIEKLKRENLHKQLLISSTVKQLQLGESPNLEVNTLNTPNTTPYQKEPFDALKGLPFLEGPGSSNKSSISQFTKFTLDHLPSLISSAPYHQVGNSKEHRSHHVLHDEMVPFEPENTQSRFKTSTPIYSNSDQARSSDGSGDLHRTKGFSGYAPSSSHGPSTHADKVRIEKSLNSKPNSAKSKLSFSHLLETPVKPEKEQHQMNYLANMGTNLETPIDPALQKCIQELLKSYAEVIPSDCRSGSTTVSTEMCTNTNKKENVGFNKNDVESTHSGSTDADRIQGDVSSESQAGGRLESRKSKSTKIDSNSKDQSLAQSQLKPPWK